MRLNLEESLFSDPRFLHLVELLEGNFPEAVGVLTCMWKFSQSRLKVYATKAEIIRYTMVSKLDGKGDLLFEKLIESEWVSKSEGEGEYRIHGNEKQLESSIQAMSRARKGGEATRKKWDEFKKINKGSSSQASKKTKARLKHSLSEKISRPNARQCKAMQGNANLSTFEISKADASDERDSDLYAKIPKIWRERISDFDRKIAGEWLEFAKEQVPNGKFNEASFVVTITKMRHEYKLSESKISELLTWCRNSDFWRNKAYSPVGLYRQKGEVKNLDTILTKMAESKQRPRIQNSDDEDMALKRKFYEAALNSKEGEK